ncbi:hypothetical protein [Palleronia sp. LCG004]|uniref:hypothetical protein n=1 Tax=Palleronia sp. LCG004 TaxID=3079304 RepID=UPI00294276C0|nr:hypothetical protein [Palleronia sp. LCG004]WOI57495.1 hypothetical protein RVY76_06855 [Palleronia sp. LCG004]
MRRQFANTRDTDPLVAGFEVLTKGPEAILASLDDLFHASQGAMDKHQVVYGRLYNDLRREYVSDPGFTPFLGLLRDHIAARWPLAAGDDLLGVPLPSRRLHSVRSASQATGVSELHLARILISVGAIAADDPRPHARHTFDAVKHAELLERLPRLVGTENMKRFCGLTKSQFAAVVEAGLLTPYLDPEVTEHPWDPEDGHALLASLLDGAPTLDLAHGEWTSLRMAGVRRRLPLVALFEALGDGRLSAGRRADLQGFDAIQVRSDEVDRAIPPQARPQTTVAEFARSIGLRDGTTLPGMIEDGLVQSIEVPNPRTGRTDSCMTKDHIAAFRTRFVTLSELVEERGEHRNTVLAWLRGAGVSPVSSKTRTYDRVFFRRDL